MSDESIVWKLAPSGGCFQTWLHMDSSDPLSGSSPLRGVAPRQVLMTISILLNISSPLGEGDINTVPQHILDNPKECAGTPPNKISISIYGSFLKLFVKKSLLRVVSARLLCPAGSRTQESFHTGWSVPTEWFPVRPPFCFNSSDWGGALSSFLPSSLLSPITISF